MSIERWIGKDIEESDCGLSEGRNAVLSFAFRNLRIADFRAEIWSLDLPNAYDYLAATFDWKFVLCCSNLTPEPFSRESIKRTDVNKTGIAVVT